MSAQFIQIEGKEAVVIPAADYRLLLEKAEMLDDVTAYDRAQNELVVGDDERIPAEIADALLDGENLIRVWRQYRKLSQVQLAEAAGISQSYLAQMETGKRDGTVGVYRELAAALRVDLDDLLA